MIKLTYGKMYPVYVKHRDQKKLARFIPVSPTKSIKIKPKPIEIGVDASIYGLLERGRKVDGAEIRKIGENKFSLFIESPSTFGPTWRNWCKTPGGLNFIAGAPERQVEDESTIKTILCHVSYRLSREDDLMTVMKLRECLVSLIGEAHAQAMLEASISPLPTFSQSV